ncbi:uncharacterized protein LOC143037242 isoform X2 [Oratosquilla oratoria]|uniref:uncharacterized protein LOC143037242 isoform X1 n=1 Tax=Oratosquilla oratoria TaxID=337810 RepID=UPI003F775B8D
MKYAVVQTGVLVFVVIVCLVLLFNDPVTAPSEIYVSPSSDGQNGFQDKVIRYLGQMRRQLQFVRDNIVDEKCAKTLALPTGGFCLNENRAFVGGNNVWDAKVCKRLEEIFGDATVGDFGAGLGHYGRCFLRNKENVIVHKNKEEAKILNDEFIRKMTEVQLLDKPQVIRSYEAFDGALNVESLSNGAIQTLDLTEEVDLGYKYSWVMSLEVGEHIPSRFESKFLNNLVRHACRGVVLSWALPGQGGHMHVNEQPNEYIQGRMDLLGFRYDMEGSMKLREVAELGWFRGTLMIFYRKNPIDC